MVREPVKLAQEVKLTKNEFRLLILLQRVLLFRTCSLIVQKGSEKLQLSKKVAFDIKNTNRGN